MIKITVEKKYLVTKGGKKFLVEICKDERGKAYASVSKNLKHVIEESEGKTKEWEHDLKGAEEVKYEDLPQNIRKALSLLHT